LDRLTKLPEDVLEAISSQCPADRKHLSSTSEPSKPTDAGGNTEEASGLADDNSELEITSLLYVLLLRVLEWNSVFLLVSSWPTVTVSIHDNNS